MKQFACLEDIELTRLPLSLGALIEHILTTELSIAKSTILDADYGAVYLLEEGDTDQALSETFGRPFPAIPFEAVQHVVAADAYICQLLRDNECVITIVLPDRAWIPEAWRSTIQELLT